MIQSLNYQAQDHDQFKCSKYHSLICLTFPAEASRENLRLVFKKNRHSFHSTEAKGPLKTLEKFFKVLNIGNISYKYQM